MREKGKKILFHIFLGIFSLAYLIVFFQVLFGDRIHDNDSVVLLVCMLLGIEAVIFFYMMTDRHVDAMEKYYCVMLAVFLIVYGMIVIANGFRLRFTPAFDMDAIYGGAIQWLREGSFTNYYEYFSYFPNNIGAMTILHFVFSVAAVFGVSDFFAVGIIFNSVIIISTALVVSLSCKKMRSAAAGVTALFFFVLCVPFLFMSAAFYTDSLSVLFPALFYYLYLHFKEQKDVKGQVRVSILMAITLSFGMMVKFTVLIILVAVMIDALICLKMRDVCLFAAISILAVWATFGIMNAYMYSAHLDKDTSTRLNTPYLHWVMMGMQGDGRYNPGDYEFTRSFEPEERNEALLGRIKERVDEMSISEMWEHLVNKAAVCFGDGTYALSDFLDDTPDRETGVHEYLLYDGKKYVSYRHFTTGLLLVLYVFMVFGALKRMFGIGAEKGYILAPRLAALGILSFLLMWETSGRYFTNFVPIMIICAVMSFDWKKGNNDFMKP